MKVSYDLHIHSCLSPCGDNEMTPNNIINMAMLLGLDIIAVSDHNSAKNLPAVFEVAAQAGMTVVPAMELCSAEEVHLLTLFPTLEQALECDSLLYKFLPSVENKPEFFGEQLILNADDEQVGKESLLLINALTLSIDKLLPMVRALDGFVIPAHIDKNANSIIANLGFIPPEYEFHCAEIKNPESRVDFSGKRITNSDAHVLEKIHEPLYTLDISEKTPLGVIKALQQ